MQRESAYAIMPVGKNVMNSPMRTTTKTPERHLRGFRLSSAWTIHCVLPTGIIAYADMVCNMLSPEYFVLSRVFFALIQLYARRYLDAFSPFNVFLELSP